MRRLGLVLVLFVLLASAEDARAVTRWQASIRVAEQVFPRVRCEGLRYRYVAVWRRGEADLPDRRVRLRRLRSTGFRPPTGRYSAEALCAVVVHERGHAAGRQHSTNLRSVMYPTLGAPYPRVCRREGPRAHFEARSVR